MGIAMSWIAAKGVHRSDLLEAMGMAETGSSRRGQPVPPSAQFVLFELGEWVFVASPDLSMGSRARVRAASRGGQALSAYLEEHVMVSGAFGAQDGDLIWSAQHDPNHGMDHLDVWGEPPLALAGIHARLREELRKRDDADYVFDAPIDLIETLCGFNPNTFEGELDLTDLAQIRPDLSPPRDPLLASKMTDPTGATPEEPLRRPGILRRLFGQG